MNVREWLPPGALVDECLRAPLDSAVALWSEAWFAGRAALQLTALEARPPLWAAELGNTAWQRPGHFLAVAVPAPALARLRSKALDMPAASRPETERDCRVLRGFERRMIADLAARIEAAFGARAGAAPESVQVQDPWSGGSEALCAIVAEASGAEAVRMGIPLERAVAFRRGNMAPRRQRAAPASREQAIGTTRVDVRARLGSASLALAELRGLSPGDVLILDRGLEEPAELLAGRDDQILGRGRLDAAERITLILES